MGPLKRFQNVYSCVSPLLLLVLLLPASRAATAAEEILWNIASDQPSEFNTMLTSPDSMVKIRFPEPQHIVSQNISIQVIRDLPKIALSVSSGSSDEGTDARGASLSPAVMNDHCTSLGLSTDCSITYTLKQFHLAAGDSVELKADFTEVIDGERSSYVKTARLTLTPRGTFRLGVGTLFIPSEDAFVTRPVDDEYEISKSSGSGLSLQLAATVTWVPYSGQFGNDWSLGPTLGLGTDADNLSVFLGYSAIFRRAWTFTLGAAAVKEANLNELYAVGDRVPEAIDSSLLSTESYEIRPFVGLTWTPASDQ